MVTTGERRRGRPPTLNRALIVEAAHAQLDEGGLENFSMRSLAARLGVTPMAVYRHAGDREQLLSLVLDDVSAPFPEIDLPTDPRERIATLMHTVFDALVSARWIAEVLRAGGPGGAGAFWLVDQILVAAQELGLSGDEALAMYRELWSYTLGSVLASATATDEPAAVAATQRKIDALGAERFPHLAAALHARATIDHRLAYCRGVGYLIDGFGR
ncbi:MAG: helix-turn-helix domain-containing protein [Mycobacterium sp.]|nr:helix-turn-helix domain-containing protein [Mycobacterium sp.]